MRQSLHSLLVGLLALSLSIDAARACGHLRHWHHCSAPAPVSVVILTDDAWGWCGPVEPACGMVDSGCGDMDVVLLAADDACCCAGIAVDAPLDALDTTSVVVATPIAPEPGPTLAPAPPPAESVPAPLAVVPALEPVEPVSAAEPAVAGEARIEEPAMQPAPAAAPAPRNAFDDADAAALAPDIDAVMPASDPAPAPAADPAVEPQAAREPLRRWIDATATAAVMGRLVAVHGDRVAILKADGRSVTVPLDRLSGFDRGYVTAAAARIASTRPGGPRPTDTAGR